MYIEAAFGNTVAGCSDVIKKSDNRLLWIEAKN